VFGGFSALTVETDLVPDAIRWLARLTPSGALTEALAQALAVSFDWFGVAVVAVWGLLAGVGAVRWFRFS
jgi:ABC-2 type transport system permease protein